VPEATVTATNTETNLPRTVKTDAAGQYAIPQLGVGHYQVRVEKDGFSPFVQTDVLLQVNTQLRVEAMLQVRAANEQVTGSAAADLLQTNSSTLVEVVDQQRVSDLPLNARNVLSLISLDASVMTKNVPSSVTQSYNLGQGLYYTPVALAGAPKATRQISCSIVRTTTRYRAPCPGRFRTWTPLRNSACRPVRLTPSTGGARRLLQPRGDAHAERAFMRIAESRGNNRGQKNIKINDPQRWMGIERYLPAIRKQRSPFESTQLNVASIVPDFAPLVIFPRSSTA
jgi:hypothetical protein